MSVDGLRGQCILEKSCCFCGLDENDEFKFGKFYSYVGIHAHHFCALFSSNLLQHGEDSEGILGFLEDDIQAELKRGSRLICTYCKKKGATIGCCVKSCKKVYHYPCGLINAAFFRFTDNFSSFCISHRPYQDIPRCIDEDDSSPCCSICLDSVEPKVSIDTLYSPCCFNGRWYHRNCVQQLALTSGYFFKCPLCNNNKLFQEEMLYHGIYIPERDAAWELEPNAFMDLLERHSQCDRQTCRCVKGRSYSADGGCWEVVLCNVCGSSGAHLACARLSIKDSNKYVCLDCSRTLKQSCPSASKRQIGKRGFKSCKRKIPKKNKLWPFKSKSYSTFLYPNLSKADIMKIIKHSKKAKVVIRKLSDFEVEKACQHTNSKDEIGCTVLSNLERQVLDGDINVITYQEFTNRLNDETIKADLSKNVYSKDEQGMFYLGRDGSPLQWSHGNRDSSRLEQRIKWEAEDSGLFLHHPEKMLSPAPTMSKCLPAIKHDESIPLRYSDHYCYSPSPKKAYVDHRGAAYSLSLHKQKFNHRRRALSSSPLVKSAQKLINLDVESERKRTGDEISMVRRILSFEEKSTETKQQERVKCLKKQITPKSGQRKFNVNKKTLALNITGGWVQLKISDLFKFS